MRPDARHPHPIGIDKPGAPRVLLRATLCAVVVGFILPTVADTDLWGHLRFGLDIISDRSLPARDPYSFTSDRHWINHEWLAELLMALAYRAGRVPGFVALKSAVVLAAVAIIFWSIGPQGRRSWKGDALVAFVFLTGLLPLTGSFRPHVFSVVMFVILLTVVRRVETSGRTTPLWILPPLFALWANTHGGWVVGSGVVAIWSLAATADRQRPVRFRSRVLIAAVLAAAATLVNPYGWGLWRFLLETVRFERADIKEWSPMFAHRAVMIQWIITTSLALWFLRRPTSRRWSYIGISLFLCYASARVARLGPFYSMAVGLLLGPSMFERAHAEDPERSAPPAAADRVLDVRIPLLTCLMAAALFLSVTPGLARCLPPMSGLDLDLEAAAYIKANQLKGRMVTWFSWGEFVIWHFAPDLLVSMDGRRETVYSAATLERHQHLWRAEPGSREYLDSLRADYIWIPNTLELQANLRDWGWHVLLQTGKSTIWSRRAVTASPVLDGTATTECFPALQPVTSPERSRLSGHRPPNNHSPSRS